MRIFSTLLSLVKRGLEFVGVEKRAFIREFLTLTLFANKDKTER